MTNLSGSIVGQDINDVANYLGENIFGVELAIRKGAKTYQDIRAFLYDNKPTKEQQRSARIVPLKQGRNDYCACKSGKKFKRCCGQ